MKHEKIETPIVRDILDALEAIGVEAWRQQSGKVRVRGGWMNLAPEYTPDVIGYLPRGPDAGRMLAIEVKTPDKRSEMSAGQIAWGERARAARVLHVVARTPEEAVRPVLEAMR